MSFFLVPDNVDGNLQIPEDSQKGRYYYSHFIDEKIEAQGWRISSEVM